MSVPTLRLAWREVIRHRWRSLLVCVLIGLPVMISVGVSTVFVAGESDFDNRFGTAQTRVMYEGFPIAQDGQGGWSSGDRDEDDVPEAISQAEAVKRARQIADGSVALVQNTMTSVISGDRAWHVEALVADFRNDLTSGLIDLDSGRLPRAADEVMVSSTLASRGIGTKEKVTVGGATLTVVGVSAHPYSSVAFTPDAKVITESSDRIVPPLVSPSIRNWELLVGGPEPTAEQISRWNAAGFYVETSEHQFDESTSNEEEQLIALVVIALVIEVVLLAGPAFAVGVRRQRHDLALLAVAGGDKRHLRRVVLFQGFALGVIASVAGAALGLLAGRLALPIFNRFGAEFGAFQVPWPAVVAAVLLGTLAATAAAFLPARHAARTDVTTALAGRQPDPKVTSGWPIIGAAILAIALLGSITAPRVETTFAEGPHDVVYESGVSSDFANAWWAVLAVIGAILLTPWLIRMAARLGRRLPLPLRLALRESDRHRARTAPAIAAVMASVSAVTALGIASSSDAAQTGDDPWRPAVADGTVQVNGFHLDAIAKQVQADTGVRLTPLPEVMSAAAEVKEESQTDYAYTVAVADKAALAAWGVTLTPAQEKALASGKALAAPEVVVKKSHVRFEMFPEWSNDPPRSITIPAVAAPNRADDNLGPIAGIVISAETAKKHGLEVTTQRAIADRPVQEIDLNAVRVAAATASPASWYVDVAKTEKHSNYFWAYLVLAIAGTFAVLLGTFSATALTLTDARDDLRTLGEVGAAPRTRRMVAGSHALLIALLGAGLGVLVGMTPGIVAARLLTRWNEQGWTLDIPWLLFGLLLIALPLLAGGITAAVSRGPRPHPVREAV